MLGTRPGLVAGILVTGSWRIDKLCGDRRLVQASAAKGVQLI